MVLGNRMETNNIEKQLKSNVVSVIGWSSNIFKGKLLTLVLRRTCRTRTAPIRTHKLEEVCVTQAPLGPLITLPLLQRGVVQQSVMHSASEATPARRKNKSKSACVPTKGGTVLS